jgi:hypothetical protein
VADTTEKDFEPNIVFSGFPPCDYGWSKRRCWTSSRISLRVILAI